MDLPSFALQDAHGSDHFRSLIDEFGFVIVTEAYSPRELKALRSVLLDIEAEATPENGAYVYQGEHLWAIWNLYELSPALMRLAFSPLAFSPMAAYFGEPAEFYRATMMKKVPGNPRGVGWHQDLAVAVERDLQNAASLGLREGVPHRDVDVSVYERIIIARINVEPQYEDGGSLQVIPGSHRWGKLSREETFKRVDESTPLVCPAPAGSVLFYRPLLAHSSGPNTRSDSTHQRRVIHNEFHAASTQPGAGVSWYPWRHTARIEKEGVYFSHNEVPVANLVGVSTRKNV
jgi:hypothetical protein